MGRSFPQADEPSMIVGEAFVRVPVNSRNLGVAKHVRPSRETRFEKVPDRASTMRGPVRISIVKVVLSCRRSAQPGAAAETRPHHSFEPRLRFKCWIGIPVRKKRQDTSL